MACDNRQELQRLLRVARSHAPGVYVKLHVSSRERSSVKHAHDLGSLTEGNKPNFDVRQRVNVHVLERADGVWTWTSTRLCECGAMFYSEPVLAE